jgi:hypothetical protein
LKIIIKNVIKQPGPIGTSLVPVQSGQGWSVSGGAGASTGSPRCRPVPTGAGAADRPLEMLSFINLIYKTKFLFSNAMFDIDINTWVRAPKTPKYL